MQQNIASFNLTQRDKQLLMRVILTINLSQSVVKLSQTFKNLLKKICSGLLI